MADTSQQEFSEPHTNGVMDGLTEEEKSKMRPADIDADMREMERRKRVEMMMNSRLFREELERIIETQMKDGAGPSGLLQQISDMMGAQGGRFNGNVFKNSNCVVPINDIRGVESMGYAKGEKLLRCKLAAVFRLLDLYGWTQGVGGQITARLNQDQEHFLVNPYGLLYHEVTASSLVKVDMQGSVVEQGTTNFGVHVTGFQLHSTIHAARPDLKCIVHITTPSVTAISSLKCGLLPIGQESILIGEVSTHQYIGGSFEPEEREKITRNLGPMNKVMLLMNRGALCCGETVEEAFFNVYNTVLACETQLKLMPAGLDNLNLISEESKKAIFEASRKPPMPQHSSVAESSALAEKLEKRWKIGGTEFEALMRMLDNAGFRTGYIYRNPLVKGEPPRPRNDVEVPPAVSSLGYLLEEEEAYKQGLWKGGRKGTDRSRWLNSPNVYQKVEILETGTPDPKKITKWVDQYAEEWVSDGSPTHSSTPVKIDSALQFVPKNTNPKEFKQIQQQIKDYRRADKISAGPQSHILEGVTWEEAKKMQDATISGTGEQVVLVGAASKGIIQRGFQHNAMVYKTPYAKNPFDAVTDQELDQYKREVERKQKGDPYDESQSESEALSSFNISRATHESSTAKSPIQSPVSVTSETEEESRDEPRVLRIETKQVPVPSQPEIVLSDVDATTEFLNEMRRTAIAPEQNEFIRRDIGLSSNQSSEYGDSGSCGWQASEFYDNPHLEITTCTTIAERATPMLIETWPSTIRKFAKFDSEVKPWSRELSKLKYILPCVQARRDFFENYECRILSRHNYITKSSFFSVKGSDPDSVLMSQSTEPRSNAISPKNIDIRNNEILVPYVRATNEVSASCKILNIDSAFTDDARNLNDTVMARPKVDKLKEVSFPEKICFTSENVFAAAACRRKSIDNLYNTNQLPNQYFIDSESHYKIMPKSTVEVLKVLRRREFGTKNVENDICAKGETSLNTASNDSLCVTEDITITRNYADKCTNMTNNNARIGQEEEGYNTANTETVKYVKSNDKENNSDENNNPHAYQTIESASMLFQDIEEIKTTIEHIKTNWNTIAFNIEEVFNICNNDTCNETGVPFKKSIQSSTETSKEETSSSQYNFDRNSIETEQIQHSVTEETQQSLSDSNVQNTNKVPKVGRNQVTADILELGINSSLLNESCAPKKLVREDSIVDIINSINVHITPSTTIAMDPLPETEVSMKYNLDLVNMSLIYSITPPTDLSPVKFNYEEEGESLTWHTADSMSIEQKTKCIHNSINFLDKENNVKKEEIVVDENSQSGESVHDEVTDFVWLDLVSKQESISNDLDNTANLNATVGLSENSLEMIENFSTDSCNLSELPICASLDLKKSTESFCEDISSAVDEIIADLGVTEAYISVADVIDEIIDAVLAHVFRDWWPTESEDDFILESWKPVPEDAPMRSSSPIERVQLNEIVDTVKNISSADMNNSVTIVTMTSTQTLPAYSIPAAVDTATIKILPTIACESTNSPTVTMNITPPETDDFEISQKATFNDNLTIRESNNENKDLIVVNEIVHHVIDRFKNNEYTFNVVDSKKQKETANSELKVMQCCEELYDNSEFEVTDMEGAEAANVIQTENTSCNLDSAEENEKNTQSCEPNDELQIENRREYNSSMDSIESEHNNIQNVAVLEFVAFTKHCHDVILNFDMENTISDCKTMVGQCSEQISDVQVKVLPGTITDQPVKSEPQNGILIEPVPKSDIFSDDILLPNTTVTSIFKSTNESEIEDIEYNIDSTNTFSLSDVEEESDEKTDMFNTTYTLCDDISDIHIKDCANLRNITPLTKTCANHSRNCSNINNHIESGATDTMAYSYDTQEFIRLEQALTNGTDCTCSNMVIHSLLDASSNDIGTVSPLRAPPEYEDTTLYRVVSRINLTETKEI